MGGGASKKDRVSECVVLCSNNQRELLIVIGGSTFPQGVPLSKLQAYSSSQMTEQQQQQQSLAKSAHAHFHNKEYDKALDALSRLQQHKAEDPKILHNLAVASYYKSSCTDPRRLLAVLTRIRSNAEAKIQKEGGDSTEKTDLSDFYSDPTILAILCYNEAVINFQLRQYSTALGLLENQFRNIEGIDEDLAIKTCFLLIDLYLCMCPPSTSPPQTQIA